MANILGSTEVGTVNSSTNNAHLMTKVTAGADFDVNVIKVYIDPDSPSNQNVSVAIYSDNAGVPNALLGQGDITSYPSGAGWKTIPLDSPVSVTNGTAYWLGMWVTVSGHRRRIISGSPSYSKTVLSGFPDWSVNDPWSGGTSGSSDFSIYGTDEVSTNDQRAAKVTGQDLSNSTRPAAVFGGHGRYIEGFSTTDKKDTGNTTAHWTTDGVAEMTGA